MAFVDLEIKEKVDDYEAFFRTKDPRLAHLVFRRVFGMGKKWRGH